MYYKDSSCRKSIPLSVRNWIHNLNSFKRLWETLKLVYFESFSPRYLNQDPLENVLGQICVHVGCNSNRTCFGFRRAFKTLLISCVLRKSSLVCSRI